MFYFLLDHVWIILRSFWDHFGIILGSCLDHVGIVLGSFWDHFGIILDQFRIQFGSFCNHFGIILGSRLIFLGPTDKKIVILARISKCCHSPVFPTSRWGGGRIVYLLLAITQSAVCPRPAGKMGKSALLGNWNRIT